MTPRTPRGPVQSLPPILRITRQHSLLSCSKGARGLSVLPRATGVFTGTTNSQCPSLRQRPDRYAIRAGRNLPDKEFRYLRTVIVTAAVYRGFSSELSPPLNGSVSPSMILFIKCLLRSAVMFEHPLLVPRGLFAKARFIVNQLPLMAASRPSFGSIMFFHSSFQVFPETNIEVFCFTADDVDVEH